MPTTLSITLDASQYDAAIKAVDAEAKKMGQDLSAAGNEACKALAGVSAAAQSAASATAKSGSAVASAGGSIKKAGAAASAVGAAFGAASPKLAVFGQALQALVSGPIGLITAAISALVAIGIKVWDAMTESTEEYAAKCEQAAAAAGREVEKTSEQAAVTAAYIAKLNELNSAENATNSTRQMTIDTLEVLEQKYGDLGAQIDATTGKIVNLDEVEQRVRKKSAQEQSTALKKQAQEIENQAQAQYGITKGNEWWTTEAGARKMFLDAAGSGKKMSDWLQSQANASTDQEEINGYGKAADLMRKAEELRQKADSLTKTGYASEEEARAATIAAQDRRSKARGSFFDAKDNFKKRQENDQIAAALGEGNVDGALKKIREQEKNLEDQKKRLVESQKKAAGASQKARESGNAQRIADAEAAEYNLSKQILDIDEKIYETRKKTAAIQKDQQKQTENLQKSLRDDVLPLAQKAAEAAGKGKEFAEGQALFKARETKGADLTDDERDQVKRISALTWEMNHRADPAFGDLSIRTNSLTARGGFASGAVKPDTTKINQQINQSVKAQLAILGTIAQILQSMPQTQTNQDVHKLVELFND